MAETDRDRAFAMAEGAWATFGHSSEPQGEFAARIADIGAQGGLSAAAEAIAEDCRRNGLQMSAKRVLKGFAWRQRR
jgi:hypothetical protein